MFSLFVKLLVPVASAAAVYIPTKTVTPVAAFEGAYTQVGGNCGSQSIVVQVDATAGSLLMSSATADLSIPSIDKGRQATQGGTSTSTSDGYGTITNISTNLRAMETITTTASLKGSTLTIRRHITEGFSRGHSPADFVCILQK